MVKVTKFYTAGLWWRQLLHDNNDSSATQNKERATVLLLHGWMGTGEDMIELGTQLARVGLTVLIPDLPFHGKSANEGVASILEAGEKMKSSIESFLASSNGLVLCGYSMGGRIALDMALRWDELRSDGSMHLVGVICLSSALPTQTATERAQMKESEQAQFERMSKMSTKAQYANWLRNSWYSSPMWGGFRTHPLFDSIVRRRADEFTVEQRDAWADSLLCLGTSTMDLHSLQHNDIPLLYLHGEYDSKYKTMSNHYRALFPKSVCVCVPHAGHNILAENVHNVTCAVLEFLLQHATPQQHLYLSITNVQLIPYSIPLTRPMNVSGNKLLEREGLLLKLQLNSGHTGIGDVTPLPDWHNVGLGEVREELLQFVNLLPCGKIDPLSCSIESDVAPLLVRIPAPGSTAVESAIIQALASSLNYSLFKYLDILNNQTCDDVTDGTQKVGMNALVRYSGVLPRLLFTTQDHWINAMTELVTCSRSRTLKLKVGASDEIEHDITFTLTAARIAKVNGKQLRLDANRAWSIREWEKFRDGIDEVWNSIEYIEEPVQCTEDLITLSRRVSCFRKIALDETLTQCRTAQLNALLDSGMICAVVVKPYMFRSISSIFELCSKSGRLGFDVVFSCAFESGAGLAWVSILSSWCSIRAQRPEVCHGLGTFQYLATDVMKPNFQEFCVIEQSATVDTTRCSKFLEMLTTNDT